MLSVYSMCIHRNQLQIILGGRSSSLVTPYGTGAYESEGLISELPRRVLLRNPAYLTREEGCSAAAKARRESGSTTNTMIRTATTSSSAITAFSVAPGAMITPCAPKRKWSAQKRWLPSSSTV